MASSFWDLLDQTACLRLDGLSARLAADRPDQGLSDVRVGQHLLAEAHLLGLALPSLAEGWSGSVLECYSRGRDFVAAYPESSSWPVRVDIRWHASSADEVSGALAGVDVIVSVRTELLDSWPELAVQSRLAATHVLRLADAQAAQFVPCGSASSERAELEGGSAPCCLVFRLPDSPFSYAEMVHPADCQGIALAKSPRSPAFLEVRHRLFAERLEKGVILRARVRGVVVDRADDLRVTSRCYASLAAAEPPLGT